MRQNFGRRPLIYPQPVLIVATYNDDGSITVHDHLYIYPQVKMPFDNRGDNPEQFGLGLDAHKGDTLTIHYLDKEEVIDVYKLYEENVK